MKIVDKTCPLEVYFSELEIGDTFLHNGSFFMKIKTGNLNNSFNFIKKEEGTFFEKARVEPVDCEIIFTNKK